MAASHDGVTRAYTSHWVSQVSFEEPVVMASVSPKHDTWPLIEGSGRYTVSLLAADQIAEGEYSSRHGWRVTGDKAREPGVSIRDQLLARLGDAVGDDDGEN